MLEHLMEEHSTDFEQQSNLFQLSFNEDHNHSLLPEQELENVISIEDEYNNVNVINDNNPIEELENNSIGELENNPSEVEDFLIQKNDEDFNDDLLEYEGMLATENSINSKDCTNNHILEILYVVNNKIEILMNEVKDLQRCIGLKRIKKPRKDIHRCTFINRKNDRCRGYFCKQSKSLCYAHYTIITKTLKDSNYLYGSRYRMQSYDKNIHTN